MTTTATSSSPASPTPAVDQQTSVVRKPGLQERDIQGFRRRRRVIDLVLQIGAPSVLLLAWQVVSSIGIVDERFWPPPTAVIAAFAAAIRSGDLLEALTMSCTRIIIGFVAGAVVGILFGLVMGALRPLRVALDPLIGALYTIPKLALLPLLLLIFGLGDAPKIILIALATFFITVISTTAAVVNIPESYLEAAKTFNASRLATFRHVMLPAITPEVVVSLRLAAGNSVLVLVGIEFVQGGSGLGWMIWQSWQLFAADRMYVGIIAVALVGVIFQSLIKLLGRLVAPWSHSRD